MTAQVERCWCETCEPNTIENRRFIVCPECGNKRCPKANNHVHACTNSNAIGQPGSSWEHVKPITPHRNGGREGMIRPLRFRTSLLLIQEYGPTMTDQQVIARFFPKMTLKTLSNWVYRGDFPQRHNGVFDSQQVGDWWDETCTASAPKAG